MKEENLSEIKAESTLVAKETDFVCLSIRPLISYGLENSETRQWHNNGNQPGPPQQTPENTMERGQGEMLRTVETTPLGLLV